MSSNKSRPFELPASPGFAPDRIVGMIPLRRLLTLCRTDLPYGKILSLLQKDVVRADSPNYYRFMVGMAPGGTVAMWLDGKEVFFGQAKKVKLDFAKAFPLIPSADRAKDVKATVGNGTTTTPKILAAIRKNGIPFQKWANYRTRYNWVPTFATKYPPKKVGIGFYNGEEGYFNFPLEQVFNRPFFCPLCGRWVMAECRP